MSQYLLSLSEPVQLPLYQSQMKFKTSFNNCIQTALSNRKYEQTFKDDWNIYWCQKHLVSETLDKMRLYPHKRINHFRNWQQICRKDLLSKNIKRYKKALEKQGKNQQACGYSYLPLTYNLPIEYSIFREEYKRIQDKQKTVWIMKPVGLSQGKGIFLFRNLSSIQDWSNSKNQSPYIVQLYIYNPLLIGHKKFDLRIYVLVTSHSNLTIYLYRSGFARFTHCRYDDIDINKLDGHITNVAVQKNSQNYDDQKGGKYLLDKLKLYLISKYGSDIVEQCFYQIQQIIIKTLVATAKLIVPDQRCFQLYGFDILIDEKLKPWLIQINASPSMTSNTEVDKALKVGLIDDLLTIIDMEKVLSGYEKEVGGFDLIYKNQKIVKKGKEQVSMLGCFSNRVQNLKLLRKQNAIRLLNSKKTQQSQTDKRTRNKSINITTRIDLNRKTFNAKQPQMLDEILKIPSNNNKRKSFAVGNNINQMCRVSNFNFTKK